MKTISLKKAWDVLDGSAWVIWNNQRIVCYPALLRLTNDPNHEFLFLEVVDENGQVSSARCREGDNETVTVDGGRMFFKGIDGQEIELLILGYSRTKATRPSLIVVDLENA